MKLPVLVESDLPCLLERHWRGVRQPVGFNELESSHDTGAVQLEARELPPEEQLDAIKVLHNWLTQSGWLAGAPTEVESGNDQLRIFQWDLGDGRKVMVHLHVKGKACRLGRLFGQANGFQAELKPTDNGVWQWYGAYLGALQKWLCEK